MRIVLLGAPGSGVASQARMVAGALRLPAVGADHVFRVHAAGSPLGARVRACLATGREVPDEDANAMVRERLSHRDARRGWVLHGHPTTERQAEELERWCADCGQTLDGAILLGVPRSELLRRLEVGAAGSDREPPEAPSPAQGGQVADARALALDFDRSAAPLLAWFQRRGLLAVVDGRGEREDVARRCVDAARHAVRSRSVPA